MEFLSSFFSYAAVISKNEPLKFGLLTVFTMTGLGLACAAIADVVFKILGINLGKYDHGHGHH
ncbi:MAG: hypothetical protein ACOY4I_03605 [Bacillota bacterium]